MDLKGPVEVHCDNKSCLAMIKERGSRSRSKHLDVKLHWLRQLVQEHAFLLKYCSTETMRADILTKALGRGEIGTLSH